VSTQRCHRETGTCNAKEQLARRGKRVANMTGAKSNKVQSTSFDVFEMFIKHDTERGTCDASGILTRPCYEAWLKTRRGTPSNPEDSYRRTITAHVTGTKKRRPFPEAVEKDLLPRLREGRIWPCFIHSIGQDGKPLAIGRSGFRAHGYHETRKNKDPKGHGNANKPKTATRGATHFRATPVERFTPLHTNRMVPVPWTEPDQFPVVHKDDLDFILEILSDSNDKYPTSDTSCDLGALSDYSATTDSRSPTPRHSKRLLSNATDVWDETLESQPRRKSLKTYLKPFKDDVDQLVEAASKLPEQAAIVSSTLALWYEEKPLLQFLLTQLGVNESDFAERDFPVTKIDEQSSQVVNRVLLNNSSSLSTRGNIASLITRSIPPNVIRELFEVAARNNEQLCTPQLREWLYRPIGDAFSDYEFSRTFRSIKVNQASPILPGVPTGMAIFSMSTGRYISCNGAARQIMKGNLEKMSLFSIMRSAVRWWVILRDVFSLLHIYHDVSFQTTSYRLNGEPIVLRVHCKLFNNQVQEHFQDISSSHPQLLNNLRSAA